MFHCKERSKTSSYNNTIVKRKSLDWNARLNYMDITIEIYF